MVREGLGSLRRRYGLGAKHRDKNEFGKFRQQRQDSPARKGSGRMAGVSWMIAGWARSPALG